MRDVIVIKPLQQINEQGLKFTTAGLAQKLELVKGRSTNISTPRLSQIIKNYIKDRSQKIFHNKLHYVVVRGGAKTCRIYGPVVACRIFKDSPFSGKMFHTISSQRSCSTGWNTNQAVVVVGFSNLNNGKESDSHTKEVRYE